MLSWSGPAAGLCALAALLACCDGGHARALKARRAAVTTAEPPTEAPTEPSTTYTCGNVTDFSPMMRRWFEAASVDEVEDLLASHGGLPGAGDSDYEYYLEEPQRLPYLSPDEVEEVDEDEVDGDEKDGDQEDRDEMDGDEKGADKKDGDKKDGDEKDDDEKGADKKDGDEKDGNKKDGDEKDGNKKDGDEKDDDEKDDEDQDENSRLVDYFSDFIGSNPDESMVYNYSASDFTTFMRVERAITFPRERLLQADPPLFGELDVLPEAVSGVVGELWWVPEDIDCQLFFNLAYVSLEWPNDGQLQRYLLREKSCYWPTGQVKMSCLGPDAAEPFDNQGSDMGMVIAEKLLGLPVHVHNATGSST